MASSTSATNDWTTEISAGTNYCAFYSVFEVDAATLGTLLYTDEAGGDYT
jgi:hypothetical protein